MKKQKKIRCFKLKIKIIEIILNFVESKKNKTAKIFLYKSKNNNIIIGDNKIIDKNNKLINKILTTKKTKLFFSNNNNIKQ